MKMHNPIKTIISLVTAIISNTRDAFAGPAKSLPQAAHYLDWYNNTPTYSVRLQRQAREDELLPGVCLRK